ncbi:DUF763 domain-containing protein [Sphingomonas morindae]|uniref:DUF763 domain-containing protein n=1 Tax=Sphingomonas morindae TaxID=1541170 RepID=A0ABY4X6K7_9SPHN|nr:DUF763 domain-containing protein [Sphingomonas morindae]USI72516.1 DUF763 domain-containing protein [Sphingomonas morindae]
MSRAAGRADLPLHGGRVPAWLGERMTRLGTILTEAILLEYGRDEFLRRLSHPFWFQSFGAVMGMDWHSSGITTSVLGALKRGLAPRAAELGLTVCGGRGRHSRATPDELLRVGERTGLDGAALGRASRLVAKVDSAAVQDGFTLYLHGFIIADDGRWVVVQQGMSDARRQARRYHWLSEGLEDFTDAPHAAIAGRDQGRIVNLADRRAASARAGQLALVTEMAPDRLVREIARVTAAPPPPPKAEPVLPHLLLPDAHAIGPEHVVARRLHGALAAAAACGPKDFADLLLVPGIGARTVRALALVAEVIHGAPCRFSDPARFAFAHGGKDGHPFPVPLRVYDRTITVMSEAVARARLGREDRLAALRRLDGEARRLEAAARGPGVAALIAEERRRSPDYGGRTVFGPARAPAGAGAA